MSGTEDACATLCIGLDLAWFGGSANDPWSKFDCLATARLDAEGRLLCTEIQRVPSKKGKGNENPDASQLATAIRSLVSGVNRSARVVLAVDAPLQAKATGLPPRTPVPRKGSVKRRACDIELDRRRKVIDKNAGGSDGWHPNIQPGAPLVARVQHLLEGLRKEFQLWTNEHTSEQQTIIECFPAEAIWAAKRQGHYPTHFTAARAKAYKAQKGCSLTAEQVRAVVEDALLTAFTSITETSEEWEQMVSHIVHWLLNDDKWKTGVRYCGGKMLDDVVDAAICMATAISYAKGHHHVWQDRKNPDDGHIIGPGLMDSQLTTSAELAVPEQRREKTRAPKQAMMQERLTGRTRLV
jgi:hypothetical protein